MSAIPKIHFQASWTLALAMGAALPAAAQQTFPAALLQTAQTQSQEWAYTTAQPSDDWAQPGFDDAMWNHGLGGFGATGTPGAVVFTGWSDPDIWIRKTVDLTDLADKSGLSFLLHHDEDVEVYINGTQVFTDAGYTVRYQEFYLDVTAASALKDGANTIAVHCHQTVGGQYLDLGLMEHVTGDGTELVAASGGADWTYTDTDPNEDWTAPDYNDGSWSTGKSGFGGGDDNYASMVRTAWTTSDLFARTKFTVPEGKFDRYVLGLAHDDAATVYLNGTKVATMTGYEVSLQSLDITDVAKDIVKEGENVLAVTCHTDGGGQYMDATLTGVKLPVPVALGKGNRNATHAAARFFSWAPGHSRLLIGAPGLNRRVDLSGRAAPIR